MNTNTIYEVEVDGLSPVLSSKLRSLDHILLCSSYVTGPGASIELGSDDEDDETRQPKQGGGKRKQKRGLLFATTTRTTTTRSRLTHNQERHQRIALATTAKSLRLRAERHVHEWKNETELMFRTSSSPPFLGGGNE